MGKFKSKKQPQNRTRNLTLKDMEQEYAQVIRALGNRRFECLCFDGFTRICHLRGNIRKRAYTWVNADDIVLIAIREFEAGKADILQKYSPDEVRQLRKMGEIPDGTTGGGQTLEDMIVFEEQEEKEVDIDAI